MLLIPNVLPNHFFVSTHGGNEVASRPEMLTYKVTALLTVHPGHVDRTLALDKSNHLRNSIFRWYRYQHMHVIRHQMAFFYRAFLLFRQLAKHLPQMRP